MIFSAYSLVISKPTSFVLHNFISVLMFGLLYYLLQFIDSKPFVVNKSIGDDQLHIFSSQPYTLQSHPNFQPNLRDLMDSHKHFSLMSCMHFSLVTQTTVGYGNIIPISRSSIITNSIQLLSMVFITAISMCD